METGRPLDYTEQGPAPNFDEIEAAKEDLGPDATEEEIMKKAKEYAKRRWTF